MTIFLITTVAFAVIAWLADKYIPAPFGRIVMIVLILIWALRYFLPFLGVSL